MQNNPSSRWPIPMVLATACYVLLGCLALLTQLKHLDSLKNWFYFVSLVIGIGLWNRQNWVRSLGMIWTAVLVVYGISNIVEGLEFTTDTLKAIVKCLVLLSLIAVLYKYPFRDADDHSSTEDSGESAQQDIHDS